MGEPMHNSQYSLDNKKASIGSIADQSIRVDQINQNFNKFYSDSVAGSPNDQNAAEAAGKRKSRNNNFEMISPSSKDESK